MTSEVAGPTSTNGPYGDGHYKSRSALPDFRARGTIIRETTCSTLSCSSTGNLAGAVAARAAAEGLEAVVFVPADLEPEKLAAAAAYGPTIYAVDGHYDHCSRLSVELSFELPWGFVNVNLRSYYAEGSKTLAYELWEQLAQEKNKGNAGTSRDDRRNPPDLPLD